MADLDNPGPRGHEHMEPAPISTLEQFAGLMVRWHADKIQTLEHLMQIPSGNEVEMQLGEDRTVKIKLEGDILVAFQIGVQTALIEFLKLPFSVQAEEGQEASNDEPA